MGGNCSAEKKKGLVHAVLHALKQFQLVCMQSEGAPIDDCLASHFNCASINRIKVL
jgi:hypothetical protein